MDLTIPVAATSSVESAETQKGDLSRRVTRDSLWLLAGYAVTSGSGFLYWVLAARVIPPASLGVDTALLSIVSAASAVAATGIGNALLVMLPVSGSHRASLLRTAWLTSTAISVVTGLVGGVLAALVLPIGANHGLTIVAVTAATMLMAGFALQSPALTALGASKWTLFVNGPVNLLKLALVPLLVVTIGEARNPAVLATLTPVALATIFTTLWLLPRLAARVGHNPSPASESDEASAVSSRSTFFSYILRDGPATAISMGVGLSLSFLVTAMAGPEQGAVFALCYQFSIVLDLVAVGFSASLAMHSAGDLDGGRAIATRMLAKISGIVALAVVVLLAVMPVLFSFIGAFYVDNGGMIVLALLAIGCLLRTPFDLWMSLLRADHRVTRVLLVSIVHAVVLVPLVVVLTTGSGAIGAAIAVCVVSVALAIAGAVGIRTRRMVGASA